MAFPKVRDVSMQKRDGSLAMQVRLLDYGVSSMSGAELLSILTGLPEVQTAQLLGGVGDLDANTKAGLQQITQEELQYRWKFSDANSAVLLAALELGRRSVVDFKKTLQFFETPEDVARKMADIATLRPTDRVLEPSAGLGAIARIAREIVGLENVVCYEADPQRRLALIKAGFAVRGHAEAGNDFCDFLSVSPDRIVDIDVILMNPPFARGQDICTKFKVQNQSSTSI